MIEFQKQKDKQQLVTYKRTPLRLSADFSAKTFQVRMVEHGILKMLQEKKKKFPTKNRLPGRYRFRIKVEIKSFPEKEN